MAKLKSVKMPFEQGSDPIFIGEINKNGKEIKTHHLLTLLNFSVIDGSVKWTVRDERGQHITGGRHMTGIPGTEVQLCPSVPMVLHNRKRSLAPEFIFTVPYALQVYPLSSIKKKYPVKNNQIYKLLG